MVRLSLRVLIMLVTVVAQKSNIERININSMQNGVTINIVSDIKIQRSQITGWHNPSTSWSYITIYNTVGNTDTLNKSDLDEGITDLEIIQLGETGNSNYTKNKKFIKIAFKALEDFEPDIIFGFNKMPGLDLYFAADTCFASVSYTHLTLPTKRIV